MAENATALKDAIDNLGRVNESRLKAVDERLDALQKGLPTGDIDAKIQGIEVDLKKALDLKDTFDTVLKEALKEEKAANDQVHADLRAELDELVKRSSVAPADTGTGQDTLEHRELFRGWMRRGDRIDLERLEELQKKTLATDVDPDGGYAVPENLDREIIRLEQPLVAMRQVCGQISISADEYRALVDVGGAESGWVGERDARPETDTPALQQIRASMGELYANPGVTQKALDDLMFDVEAWLAESITEQFSEKENDAFTKGDGTNKPKGLLAYPTAVQSDFGGSRPFGTFEHLESKSAGAIVGDDLLDMVTATRAGYRQGAVFMMNNLTLGEVRKLKSTDNQYIWQPGLSEGQPNSIFGYRTVENEDFPLASVTGAQAAAFGNFARAYLIVDRLGTRTLRDPYTNKPFVHFYTTKRVGGMARDTKAVKFIKIK